MLEELRLNDILQAAVQADASDVHLTSGLPPVVRVDGALTPLPAMTSPVTDAWVRHELLDTLTAAQQAEFHDRGELDLAYLGLRGRRYRVNVYRQRGCLAVAMRLVPESNRTILDLGLPPVLEDFAHKPRGLVLVTGPTGSGKSTTLAAMVELINDTHPVHVLTIEDPIEYVHESHMALIHQREIGSDTKSFHEALRRALRQDPDVMLIGELRDMESIEAALVAAETGHLVMSTLHTQGAAKSVNRLVTEFPSSRTKQIRHQLGDTLVGVVSQTLLPRAGGTGRVPATEVLVNTPAVANLIREGAVAQLVSALQSGAASGMHTLDQDLHRLLLAGQITKPTALDYCADPTTFDDVVGPSRHPSRHGSDDDAQGWS